MKVALISHAAGELKEPNVGHALGAQQDQCKYDHRSDKKDILEYKNKQNQKLGKIPRSAKDIPGKSSIKYRVRQKSDIPQKP